MESQILKEMSHLRLFGFQVIDVDFIRFSFNRNPFYDFKSVSLQANQ